MKAQIINTALAICLVISNFSQGQNDLTTKDLKKHASYFKLSDNHEIDGKFRDVLKKHIKNAQFIGLAEIHQSQQLSYFTAGFLELLSEQCYNNFALELGPFSAKILQEVSSDPSDTKSKIKELNNLYGTDKFPKVPLIFVDKKEDAQFVKRAASLGYNFWGLDQEFNYSYEMHLDKIYDQIENKNEELNKLYNSSKRIIKDVIFENNFDGKNENCWLRENDTLNSFFDKVQIINPNVIEYVENLRKSMDIYCMQETGNGGNQERADLMKSNFDIKYEEAEKKTKLPKVFVKLGNVHLTHSYSQFGVDDIGKYLHEKAIENNTEFISILHIPRFKDGKDLLNTDIWKDLSIAMKLGKKDMWTFVDLRPIKKKIEDGSIKTDNNIVLFGLSSYDFILIPPDDKNGEMNF